MKDVIRWKENWNRNTYRYIHYKNIFVNTSYLRTSEQEIQNYNKSEMFYFQCVVSDGHTSTLAIVKGANVNIIETIKAKDLVKKAGIRMSNFGLKKDVI